MKIKKDKWFFLKLTASTAIIIIIACFLFFHSKTQSAPSKFYIFQTTDIHGHLDNAGTEYSGGWLKLASLLKREVKDAGGHNNCLLVDCGDTFQGTIEAEETRGKCAIPVLNGLKYDVFVPGNHDFDYGLKTFLSRISHINADILAANLDVNVHSTKQILPWKIYIKGGVKIAVIGMTSPYLKYWLWGNDINNYNVASITDSLNKIMPAILKAKPDVIVLAFHHGIYNSHRFPGKDKFLFSIIKKFPQIDIVLGGHTHQNYPGECVYNNTIYVQAGCYAQCFAKLEVNVPHKNKQPFVKTELIPVSSKVKTDKKLTKTLAKTIKECNIKRNTIVAKTDKTISNKEGRLFAKAILNTTNADASMNCAFNDHVLKKGNITYKDIFNISFHENKIILLTLTYSELKEIIAEQSSFKDKYRKKLNLYCKAALVKEIKDFCDSASSKKVKNGKAPVHIDNKNLLNLFKKKNKIKVAFTSYDIAGAGNRFPVLKKIAQNSRTNPFDTQLYLRDALVRYFKSGTSYL